MYVSAIVLAAGRGRRFKSRIPKPLLEINSRPVIIYSLQALSRYPQIKDIILVVNQKNLKGIARAIKKYRLAKIKKIVLGGKERQDSVAKGLESINPKTRLVLIHDAARPFIDQGIISSVIREAKKAQAAVVGVPAKDTIKKAVVNRSALIVHKTLDRDSLWEIQTPQVFKKDLILAAYQKFGKRKVTDDAMLVEKMGAQVSIVRGSYKNIKITTPEDLAMAQVIAKTWKAASA